ncbi:MAG TPA: M50 family metallopeptidase [Acidimicrobiales bacterium]|jgi:membrane-associated protease RseP (regulator of RpoE activity)|nr:M50 family metallopeptidase [Acidimicrobiales bacterium]
MTDTLDRTDTPQPKPPTDPDETRKALIRLAIVVVGGLLLAARVGVIKTVLVVIALLVMIMLHEFGHFVAAKKGGMKVTEFFVGFGPRLWSIRKGETEYGVKALPLGGYVKIIGMHNLDRIEDPADEPRTYRQQPFPQRLGVAVAGSMMHFLIAIVLFAVINTMVGIPQPSLRVGEISRVTGERSPAEQAGFQVGDRIVSVDGQRYDSWDQIPPYIRARPEQPIEFVVERGDRTLTLTATPLDMSKVTAHGQPASKEPRGFIGIGPSVELATKGLMGVPLAFEQLIGGDFDSDPNQVAPGLVENAKALAQVFSPSGMASYWRNITGDARPGTADEGTRFLSPVGLVRIAGTAADTGWLEVLILLIMINIFVGLFNLVPLLPLDGGHVIIAVYEAIRSKIQGARYYTDVAKLMPLTYAAFLLIVFLGASALYLDIARPLQLN